MIEFLQNFGTNFSQNVSENTLKGCIGPERKAVSENPMAL